MNDRMRRYLDEDWDEQAETRTRERDDDKAQKPLAFDRRQRDKAWGKAMAKYHRTQRKLGNVKGKP